jgi:hypothetical protein
MTSTTAAQHTEREATQDPGVEFNNVLGELEIQTTCITAAQKGKGMAVESSPAPAPEEDNSINLDDAHQRDEIQQNTVINIEDSDDPWKQMELNTESHPQRRRQRLAMRSLFTNHGVSMTRRRKELRSTGRSCRRIWPRGCGSTTRN